MLPFLGFLRMTSRARPLTLAAALIGACAHAPGAQADEGGEAAAAPLATVRPSEDPALVIGTFKLMEGGIVDGDTLKVEGLRRAAQLILIDTEEMPHAGYDQDLVRLMEQDFEAYKAKVTEGYSMPAKYATPLGVDATRWAERYLEGVEEVLLERDHPDQTVDSFGRTLCYVWAVYKDGRAPTLYNLDAVRAGMTPYFNKYGRSLRFDAQFRAAQDEARKAGRGIWDPKRKHYPDYETRLAWWDRRAEALARYERVAKQKDAPIHVDGSQAIRTLLKKFPRNDDKARPVVTVFGLIDEHDREAVMYHEDGATLRLGGQRYIEVEIRGKDLVTELRAKSDALRGADSELFFGDYVVVHGPLDREGSPIPKTESRYMRLVVTDAAQIGWGHELELPAPPPGK